MIHTHLPSPGTDNEASAGYSKNHIYFSTTSGTYHYPQHETPLVLRMKMQIFIMSAAVLLGSCHHPLKDPGFVSERIEKTATIILKGKPEQVFPLFGAFEERKWAEGWQPVLVYPDKEIILEGTTFLTHGHGHGENKFTWIVNRYDPANFMIQYLVWSDNRHWTITVDCKAEAENLTSASITYQFTGHNATGNKINRRLLDNMYAHNLRDWADAINQYLAKK